MRVRAAAALRGMGSSAKEAVRVLSAALAKDTNAAVRQYAAGALGAIGPGAKETVPALMAILASDTDAGVRGYAAEALGGIGPAAKDTVPALTAAVAKDTDPNVRRYAAGALVKLANAARDSQRTDMIDSLAQAEQGLEVGPYTGQAKQVRTAVDLLRAIRPPWYEVLLKEHLGIVVVFAVYLLLTLVSLGLLLEISAVALADQ